MKKQSKSQAKPVSVRVTRTLYFLSLIVGIIGTYFTIRSETSNNDSMSDRVWDAFALAIAGMLMEMARSSESRVFSPAPTETASDPDEIPELELATEEKAEEQKQHSLIPAAQEPIQEETNSEIKVSAAKQNDHPEELKSPAVEMAHLHSTSRDTPEDNHFSAPVMRRATQSIINPPRHWRDWSVDILPTAWFGQAFYLWVRNILQESAVSSLLPYSTLIGIAAGQLFHVSIKPWRLWGLRDWIEKNSNTLTFPEFMAFFMLPEVIGIDLSVYYYSVSAFWSGYNFNMLVSLVTDKIFKKHIQNVRVDEIEVPQEDKVSHPISFRHRDPYLCLGGCVITATSILLLQKVPEDQAGFRNIFAQLLAAIGCYGISYPFGVYLGHKISSQYYETTLSACIYLLIPLASPDLSILHYLGMMGAGLCGGISHYIITHQYKTHIRAMEYQLQKIQSLVATSSTLFQQLIQLPLPPDWLLLASRKQQLKVRWVGRFLLLSLIVSALATESLWKNYPITLLIVVQAIVTPLIMIWIAPKYIPSIYSIQPLLSLSHFFYVDSFTTGYMVKSIAFIALQNIYNSSDQLSFLHAITTSKVIFTVNLLNALVAFYNVKTPPKKYYGEYRPYVPPSSEILRLQAFVEAVKSNQGMMVNQPLFTLNYHLLQFLKENIPRAKTGLENAVISNHDEDKSICQHALGRFGLLAVPRQPVAETPPDNPLLPQPLATLQCLECKKDLMSVQVGINPADKRYNEQRFLFSFDGSVAHAILRGNAVAQQFQFGLPAGLSLIPDANHFSI